MLHRFVRTCRLAITLLVLMVLMVALWTSTALAQDGGTAAPAAIAPVSTFPTVWYLLAAGLALLVPAGFVLLAVANLEPGRAWNTALGGLAAIGLAAFAYWAIGFALQFGGVGLVYPDAELRGLVWEWSPLSSEWGIGWGMAGLSGWFLSGAHVTALAYTLFLAHLPWVMLAAALPIMSLRGRAPSTVTLIIAVLIGGLIYPFAGNWVQGGGWLNALGRNLTLGHGFIDMGGAGTVHLVAAGFALAAMTVWAERRRDPQLPADAETMPPAHQPLLVVVGALLILAGTIGWQFANPLQAGSVGSLGMMRGAVSMMLAASGGLIVPLLYTWFVSGASEPTMTARGFAAGMVAGLAVAPFVQPGVAFLVGLLAGATVPFVTYLLDGRLRLNDATGIVATSGVPAILGLLLVGVLADGVAGSGWQMTGPGSYLGVAGQGVSGILVASGYQIDFPGQLQAQLIGVASLALWGFLTGLAICLPLGLLFHSLLQASAPVPVGSAPPSPSGAAAQPAVAQSSRNDPFANVPYRTEPRGAEAVRPVESSRPPEAWQPVDANRKPSAQGAAPNSAAPLPASPLPASPLPANTGPVSVAPSEPTPREVAYPAPPQPASFSANPAAVSASARTVAREGYWPIDASGASTSTSPSPSPSVADPYVALEASTDPSAANLLSSALDQPAQPGDATSVVGPGAPGQTLGSTQPAPNAQPYVVPGETPLMRRRRTFPPVPGESQPT